MDILHESANHDSLFHVTDSASVESIIEHGIDPGYWGRLPIIRYYISVQLVNDPIVFSVPLAQFDPRYLEPDLRGLQDPPSASVIDLTADEVDAAWDASDQSWRACLDLIGSVRYGQHVLVTAANVLRRTL